MKISQYIPEREKKDSLTVRIKKSLRDEVEAILIDQNVTWVDFIEASMQCFIDEYKSQKR